MSDKIAKMFRRAAAVNPQGPSADELFAHWKKLTHKQRKEVRSWRLKSARMS